MTEQTILSQPTTLEAAPKKKVVNGYTEGSAPISPEALELVQEYRKAHKDIKPFTAIKKTAQELIEAEMKEKGVNQLTLNGVVECAETFKSLTKVNWEGLLAEFPGAQKYITKGDSTTFDAKS